MYHPTFYQSSINGIIRLCSICSSIVPVYIYVYTHIRAYCGGNPYLLTPRVIIQNNLSFLQVYSIFYTTEDIYQFSCFEEGTHGGRSMFCIIHSRFNWRAQLLMSRPVRRSFRCRKFYQKCEKLIIFLTPPQFIENSLLILETRT